MFLKRADLLPLAVLVAVVVTASAVVACGDEQAPSPNPSPSRPVVKGFVFAWGVHQPKNVLDTLHGTFTKDMVLASPLTVPFRLDDREVEEVIRRLWAIDFWSYPSRYVSQGDGPRLEPPAGMDNSGVLTVVTGSGRKTVRWRGGFYADDQRARDLRDLGEYIARLVITSPVYKHLPPAEGGYL